LIAEPTGSLRAWIDLALTDGGGAAVSPIETEAIASGLSEPESGATTEDGRELRNRLFAGTGVGFDVVVANARLSGLSTMQVLAQARAAALSVPFIVVRGFHGRRLHVFVGEPDGARLTSRIVDSAAFRDIVLTLGQEARRSRAA